MGGTVTVNGRIHTNNHIKVNKRIHGNGYQGTSGKVHKNRYQGASEGIHRNGYLTANLKKNLRNPFRYVFVLMVAILGIGASTLLMNFGFEEGDIMRMVKGIEMNAALIFGLIFGVYEIYQTFFADYGCRMHQSAIGSGLSRKRVVLSKFIESALYVGLDLLTVLVCATLAGRFLYGHMEWMYISNMLLPLLGTYIKMMAVMAVAILLIYLSSNVILGLVAYLIFFNFGYALEDVLLGWAPVVKGLRPAGYLLLNASESFSGSIICGQFRPDLLAAIILEVVLLLFVAVGIFRRKELSF